MTPTTPSPISDQAAGEPVAWLHTMHRPDGRTIVRAETGFMNPFGVEGEDYPEDCRVTCVPLCVAPVRSTAPTTGSAPVAVRVCPISDIECASARECESVPGKCRKIAASDSPAATGSAPVAEIVRWKTFTGHDGWDIKIFDKDIAHGTKLYAAPVDGSAPDAKPIGYVTQYALTHVLAHGGNIPMHPEPLSLTNVPVYAAPPASPAASALTDDFDVKLAALPYARPETGVQCGWNAAIKRVRALLAASMGGDRS